MTKGKKPVYEAPKAFKLEEREAVHGGQPDACVSGTSPDSAGCYDGNNAIYDCWIGNNGGSSG